MILEELVLHNFGVYRGRQTISLLPRDPQHPVVLIGGLNGEGKTTLLDALQLVLYGNRAQVSNRNGLSYEAFLKRSIHRKVPPGEGAGLELQFRAIVDGESSMFRIHRVWSARSRGVREKVTILRNGTLDRLLTETWNEYVEDLLPLEISQLFFFDGEKIEKLASAELSGGLIRTAVHSLLGIDLVERLEGDLTILERRKRTALRSAEAQEAIDVLKQDLEKAEATKNELLQDRAAARNHLDRLQMAHEKATARYRQEGGDLFDQKELLEAERQSILGLIGEVDGRLRDLASGDAPLSLLKDALENVQQQGSTEANAAQAASLVDVIEERDGRLMALLERLAPHAAAEVDDYLAKDRKTRAQGSKTPLILKATTESRQRVSWLLNSGLEEAQAKAREQLEELDHAAQKLALLERKLATIPQPESLQGIASERQRSTEAVKEAESKLAVLDELVERAGREVSSRESKYVREIEKQVDRDFEREANSRVLLHSERVRESLSAFRRLLTDRHMTRIEHAIGEAFQKLLRKETLVTAVRLDKSDFGVELLGPDGVTIDSNRLSAGERQLLAVATLWGLARVSGKALPTVIDTPLGRLDSTHRRHLVDRYFPNASHQVVLLSTDEEIDQRYLQLLEPHISHTYRLEHDDATQTTTIEAGYFWERELANAH